MREMPLMTIPRPRHANAPTLLQQPTRFHSEFLKRPSEDRRLFENLYAEDEYVEIARQIVRNDMAPGSTAWTQDMEDIARLMGIYLTNSFLSAPQSNFASAVFNEQSRINHMCSYNVSNFGLANGGEQYMYTVRDIKAGEQLTTPYIEVGGDYDARQRALACYGFTCKCPLCAMEHYINNTPDVQLDIFGRLLAQRDLEVMILVFRKWFNILQPLGREKSRNKLAEKHGLAIIESVPFSEIALAILEQISERALAQHGNASAEYSHATNNVGYWNNVVADLRKRYGPSSVWLEQVNALDPRFTE
ncbi:putative protein lysine methyltransferase SET5 [Diplodia seriata]|uniref:SET domain-containing protein n=1 Tax=Diplodia seriata TaxID=420778 RepID=A0A1S8BKG6_9PEZI|nr:putative protein lysine methyltransferase SET5 [Diplodia seriata]